MNIKTIIIAFVLFVFGACTQKTCPTYAKKDVKEVKEDKEVNA